MIHLFFSPTLKLGGSGTSADPSPAWSFRLQATHPGYGTPLLRTARADPCDNVSKRVKEHSDFSNTRSAKRDLYLGLKLRSKKTKFTSRLCRPYHSPTLRYRRHSLSTVRYFPCLRSMSGSCLMVRTWKHRLKTRPRDSLRVDSAFLDRHLV